MKLSPDQISRVYWVTLDTGAISHVADKSFAPDVPLRPSAASIAGIMYTAANNTEIANIGQKTVTIYTLEGQPLEITVQITDGEHGGVNKWRGAICEMTDIGDNKTQVVFKHSHAEIQFGDNAATTNNTIYVPRLDRMWMLPVLLNERPHTNTTTTTNLNTKTTTNNITPNNNTVFTRQVS